MKTNVLVCAVQIERIPAIYEARHDERGEIHQFIRAEVVNWRRLQLARFAKRGAHPFNDAPSALL
jgi:hypothetical protein